MPKIVQYKEYIEQYLQWYTCTCVLYVSAYHRYLTESYGARAGIIEQRIVEGVWYYGCTL